VPYVSSPKLLFSVTCCPIRSIFSMCACSAVLGFVPLPLCPHLLGFLLLLCQVIEPQQSLMQAAIELAGKNWDENERSAFAFAQREGIEPRPRRYRVQQVCDLTQEKQYLTELLVLLEDSRGVWDAMPLASRTSKMRCLAFRLLSFGGAWVHLKLARPSANYPNRTYKLAFESIQRGDMSHMGRVLRSEPLCRLDPWTKSLLEHYQEDIVTETAVIDVATRAMYEEVDNATREATHASIRRDVMKASCQSPAIELALGSGRFVDRKVRQCERHVQKMVKPSGDDVAEQVAGGDEVQEPPAKRRIGGGACRAYLSEKLRGVPKAEQNLKEAHDNYKQLTPEQLHPYVQAGRAATQAHRDGTPRVFGPTAKDTDRLHRRREMHAEQKDLRSRVKDRIRSGLLDGGRLALLTSSDLAKLPAVPSFQNIVHSVSQACRMKYTADKAAAAEKALLAEALAQHLGTGDASTQALAMVSVTCMSEQPDTEAWAHQPPLHPLVMSACWKPRGARKLAENIASLDASSAGVCKSLLQALDADWEGRHLVTEHDKCQPLGNVPPRGQACWLRDRCCCSEECTLLPMVSGLYGFFRTTFPPSTTIRTEVQLGWFVLGVLVTAPDEPGDAEGAEMHDGALPETRLFHIGFQSMSPMLAGYRRMLSASTVEDDFVTLEATDECLCDVEVMQSFVGTVGTGAHLHCRYYRLIATDAMVASFAPKHQEARAIGGAACFWSGEATWRRSAAFLRWLSVFNGVHISITLCLGFGFAVSGHCGDSVCGAGKCRDKISIAPPGGLQRGPGWLILHVVATPIPKKSTKRSQPKTMATLMQMSAMMTPRAMPRQRATHHYRTLRRSGRSSKATLPSLQSLRAVARLLLEGSMLSLAQGILQAMPRWW